MADEPWLIRDHTRWWRLPEPLPSPLWPRMLMALLIGVIVFAAAIAWAQSPGDDDVRALVCVIDQRGGRPCKLEDAEALARAEARDAERARRETLGDSPESLLESNSVLQRKMREFAIFRRIQELIAPR